MVKYFVKKNHFTGTWTVYRAPAKREDTAGLVPWELVCGGLDTWREAMDYADRRARTVEVVLPRRTVLPTDRHVVQTGGLIIEYRGSRSYPNLDTGHIAVEPEERRPLALALLALAEKEETQA